MAGVLFLSIRLGERFDCAASVRRFGLLPASLLLAPPLVLNDFSPF